MYGMLEQLRKTGVPHNRRLVRRGDKGGAVAPVAVGHGHVMPDERGVRETALKFRM